MMAHQRSRNTRDNTPRCDDKHLAAFGTIILLAAAALKVSYRTQFGATSALLIGVCVPWRHLYCFTFRVVRLNTAYLHEWLFSRALSSSAGAGVVICAMFLNCVVCSHCDAVVGVGCTAAVVEHEFYVRSTKCN